MNAGGCHRWRQRYSMQDCIRNVEVETVHETLSDEKFTEIFHENLSENSTTSQHGRSL